MTCFENVITALCSTEQLYNSSLPIHEGLRLQFKSQIYFMVRVSVCELSQVVMDIVLQKNAGVTGNMATTR